LRSFYQPKAEQQTNVNPSGRIKPASKVSSEKQQRHLLMALLSLWQSGSG